MGNLGSIKLYALSTCTHCKALMNFLEENKIAFSFVNVDELEGRERREMVKEIKQFNKRCTFPTTVVGDQVLVGFKEAELKEALQI